MADEPVALTSDEWGQVMNILATTKDHPWVVTNPLLMKIGQQRQRATTMTHAGPPPGIKLDANGKEAHNE